WMLTTGALDPSRSRWFGACLRRPAPRDLPSSRTDIAWRTVIGVPLERPPRPRRLRGALRGVARRPLGRAPPTGLQQGIHHLAAIRDRPAQLATPSPPGPDHLPQRHRLAGQLLADRAADEAALVEDPDLGDVAQVVPEQDLLPHVGRQRRV